ncbi:histidine phosphatase family protein [Marinomonas epiphytica]
MKLYLVRHPKPDVATGLCYGQLDVPILDGWQTQAEAIQRYLYERHGKFGHPIAYFHSPLSRASQLAERVSAGQSKPITALKELDFGDWEGTTWEQISKQQIDAWFADLSNSAPYQGESLQDLADRLWQWWQSLDTSQTDACVLVTHSGVIKVLVSLLCQWPLQQSHRIDVGFCSISELQVQGELVALKSLGAGDWVAQNNNL